MPKISIVTITWGHEKHIEQTLYGIFAQEYEGTIEFILSNDRSPDNSDEIIKKYLSTNNIPPNFEIKYTNHEKNIGSINNFTWSLQQSTGKYIAICDGDDYWTDPLKLQKQVDFLEKHEDYTVTFHKVKELTTRQQKFTHTNPDQEKTYTIYDLAKENFIITVSVVFRKNMEILPEWLQYSPIGDYPLHLLNASFGLIKYFPEEMAVYRVDSGMWSTMNSVDQITNTMFALRFLLQHFKKNDTVYKILTQQYSNFRALLIRPIDDKKTLDTNLKDYKYIEKITNMASLLKAIKLKFIKKLNF